MKRITIILSLLFLVSCVETTTVEIEGCEYIKTTSVTGQGPVVTHTHKGNCKNLIHHKDNAQDSLNRKK